MGRVSWAELGKVLGRLGQSLKWHQRLGATGLRALWGAWVKFFAKVFIIIIYYILLIFLYLNYITFYKKTLPKIP